MRPNLQVNSLELMRAFREHAPQAFFQVIQTLESHGYKAWAAGGSVRDLILGRVPKDYDLVTDALPEEIEKIFAKTISIGKAFGVISVLMEESKIEVATFRSDLAYVNGRRPRGVVFTNPQADALRRDFTVNGLFFDFKNLQLVDHVNGLEDLKKGIIKAIGDPEKRFTEDHLRILRAIRFSVSHGFEIESNTERFIDKLMPMVKKVSRERISDELMKGFLADFEKMFLQLSKYHFFSLMFDGVTSTQSNNRILFENAKTKVEIAFSLLQKLDSSDLENLRLTDFVLELLMLNRNESSDLKWILRMDQLITKLKVNPVDLELLMLIYKVKNKSLLRYFNLSKWKIAKDLVQVVQSRMAMTYISAQQCPELKGVQLGNFLKNIEKLQILGDLNSETQAQELYRDFLLNNKELK